MDQTLQTAFSDIDALMRKAKDMVRGCIVVVLVVVVVVVVVVMIVLVAL